MKTIKKLLYFFIIVLLMGCQPSQASQALPDLECHLSEYYPDDFVTGVFPRPGTTIRLSDYQNELRFDGGLYPLGIDLFIPTDWYDNKPDLALLNNKISLYVDGERQDNVTSIVATTGDYGYIYSWPLELDPGSHWAIFQIAHAKGLEYYSWCFSISDD